MRDCNPVDAKWAPAKRPEPSAACLAEKAQLAPWSRLIVLIKPLDPTSERAGHPPIGAQRMLRMHYLQQLYALAEDAYAESPRNRALRGLAGIEPARKAVPDANTLMEARRLLQADDLARALIDDIDARRKVQGLLMRLATAADTTIAAAASSAKHAGGGREACLRTRPRNATCPIAA